MRLKRISLAAGSAVAALAALWAPNASAADWEGLYVGADLGYGAGDAQQIIGVNHPANLDGGSWGLHAGYNFNPSGSNFVFGGEVAVEWSNIEGDDNGQGGHTNQLNIDGQYSLRGRLGYLFSPNFMVFGSVGYVHIDASSEVTSGGSPEEVDGSFEGWTYGIGGEYAFNDRWSMTGEWRRDDVDEQSFVFPLNGYTQRVTPEVDMLRIGVSRHF